MLSGNKNKWVQIQNINGLYDFINVVLTNEEERKTLVTTKFTVDEVCEALLGFVKNYTIEDVDCLHKFIATLSDVQRTKLRVAFQVKYVLTHYLEDDIRMAMDYYKSHQLDWNNITTETLQVAGFGTEIPEEIKPYLDRINQVVLDNCCYPFILNDNEVSRKL